MEMLTADDSIVLSNVPWRRLHSRETSVGHYGYRLSWLSWMGHPAETKKRGKRETWVIQGNMDKHSVRIEPSFEGGPAPGLPLFLFGRMSSLAKQDMRKKRYNFVADFRIISHLSSVWTCASFLQETSRLFLFACNGIFEILKLR